MIFFYFIEKYKKLENLNKIIISVLKKTSNFIIAGNGRVVVEVVVIVVVVVVVVCMYVCMYVMEKGKRGSLVWIVCLVLCYVCMYV